MFWSAPVYWHPTPRLAGNSAVKNWTTVIMTFCHCLVWLKIWYLSWCSVDGALGLMLWMELPFYKKVDLSADRLFWICFQAFEAVVHWLYSKILGIECAAFRPRKQINDFLSLIVRFEAAWNTGNCVWSKMWVGARGCKNRSTFALFTILMKCPSWE